MTFEEWRKSNPNLSRAYTVGELLTMKRGWDAGKEAGQLVAREECAAIALSVSEALARAGYGELSNGAKQVHKCIMEKIK